MSDNIFKRLLNYGKTPKQEPEVVCLSSSGEHSPIDYSMKFDRSEKVTFQGIGSSKYGSGAPPTFYTSPLNAVKKFPIVYGCVTAISEAVAGLSIKVYEINGGEQTEALDHPFYLLFSRPNPYQGSFEFLEQLQQTLDIMGNVFISIEKVAGGLELYLLNPQYVAIIPDPKNKVKEYRYNINGQIIKYKPEEVIHIKYTDLQDPYYGAPPLNSAADILTFEGNRLKYANQFFVNGAIPTGVLETEQNLGDPLLKKLRKEWLNLHQGVSNSHNIAILQGGLAYKSIASPIKDLNFDGLKKLSKEDILTIFKMPESVLGSQEATGSSEGKDALTAFWRGCIVPRLKRLESGLNRGLSVLMFGEGKFKFEFNLKEVVALQEDKVKQAEYLERMVGSSVMTPNEARSVMGLPPSDDEYADQLLVSNSFFGNQLMPADQAAQQGAGSNTEKPTSKPKPKPKEPAPKPKPKK